MKPVVRVVEGPLPTDVEGRELTGSFTWFSETCAAPRFYNPALVNGTKPVPGGAGVTPKQLLMARAVHVLARERALFVGLA